MFSNTPQRQVLAQATRTNGEALEQGAAFKWTLDQVAFDQLLFWLDPDPERAGQMYEIIRRKLIRAFSAKQCVSPEDLADETFNRVARKLWQIKEYYVGDPVKYFYGVARKIYLEYVRRISARETALLPMKDTVEEVLFEQLDHCIGQLRDKDRELILAYFHGSGRSKIDCRKRLAEELGIPLNTLRLRVHRIVCSLRKAITRQNSGAFLSNAPSFFDSEHSKRPEARRQKAA